MDVEALIRQLERHEGYRRHPYQDSVGKLTVGIGRNLDDVGLTRDEAQYLARRDVDRVCRELDDRLTWWRSLDEVRQRALADMGFNLGVPGLLGFRRMLAALEAGDYKTAAAEALDSLWARQVGQRATAIAGMIRSGDARVV